MPPDLNLDRAATEVLARYPAALAFGPPRRERSGFSGARVWSVGSAVGPLCLRAGPPGREPPAMAHHLIALAHTPASDLPFVPVVHPTRDGFTWVNLAQRRWELQDWMPGRADFAENPTTARLDAACAALGRLHRAWAPAHASVGECPAVRRREDALESARWRLFEWPDLPGPTADPVLPWAERGRRLLPGWLARVPAMLAPWFGRPVPLQYCVGDVWHDNLLFTDDRLTGLIDYAAVKVDHVAADLGRMLGSLIGDDEGLFARGLWAYAAVAPLEAGAGELARALDRTGVVLGAANWLRRLYWDREEFPDRAAVAGRLAALVGRMEGWKL